jgi:hypothetical protein
MKAFSLFGPGHDASFTQTAIPNSRSCAAFSVRLTEFTSFGSTEKNSSEPAVKGSTLLSDLTSQENADAERRGIARIISSALFLMLTDERILVDANEPDPFRSNTDVRNVSAALSTTK